MPTAPDRNPCSLIAGKFLPKVQPTAQILLEGLGQLCSNAAAAGIAGKTQVTKLASAFVCDETKVNPVDEKPGDQASRHANHVRVAKHLVAPQLIIQPVPTGRRAALLTTTSSA
jgi:hypothetical protein